MNTQPATQFNQARFCRVWRRCAGADDASAGAVFAELAAYYCEPHRHYHTAAHIDECLTRLDEAAAESKPRDADGVELAVWFHDVIYAIGAADNEAKSAEWFAARAGGCAPELRARVERYILDTTHRAPPSDEGARLMVDVDLSGIGMSSEMFWRDGRNIRREAANLSDEEFIRRQGGFLRGLIARERIYWTAYFYDRCETPARRNIEDALARYARGEC